MGSLGSKFDRCIEPRAAGGMSAWPEDSPDFCAASEDKLRSVPARRTRRIANSVKLLGNAKVVRYLAQNHQEIPSEFQRIAEIDRFAA
jgi:hypothetical protein